MSQLLDFYRGAGVDARGRRLEQIWAWSDADLEAVHDFIQWLFPLPERSAYNPNAPLLSDEEIAAFAADESLRGRLLRSYERFLAFAGLLRRPDGSVADGPNLARREPDVWQGFNHNWLRITRVLRSLTLLGLADEAGAFFAWLRAAYEGRRYPIEASTFRYWSEAVRPGR